MPRAPLIWAGVYPRTVHGAFPLNAVKPVGNEYGEISCPQYADSGGEFRKPAGGGASLSMTLFVWTKKALSSSPTTPVTTSASELGIATSFDGERTVVPATEYSPNPVPNAASACATVPSAA